MKLNYSIFLVMIMLCMTKISNAQWYKLNGPEGAFFTDMEKVNNQIWTGTMDGIYTSSDEGLTWTKSNLISGVCLGVKNYNDTVVILYVDFVSDIFNLNAITSFDNGITWSPPVLIDTDNSYFFNYSRKLIKTSTALFVMGYNGYFVSMDAGLSWQLASASIGFNPGSIFSDGAGAIISKSTQTFPYQAYYFSIDGTSPLVFIDSSLHYINIYLNDNVIFASVNNLIDTNLYWLRTDNLGALWDTTLITPIINNMGFGIYNYNNNLYIGNDTLTYISNDNGVSWQQGTLPSSFLLRPGVMTSSGNTVTTDNLNIVTYFPATDTTLTTSTGIAGHYINCLYANNNVLFCSNLQTLFRSTDGGLTWDSHNLWNGSIDKMVFRGDTVYAINEDYGAMLARSFDNGITWDTLSSLNYFSLDQSIAELNGKLYFSGDSIKYSVDHGDTWISFPSIPTGTIGSCQLTSYINDVNLTIFNDELWAANNAGFVFKFDTLSQSWMNKFCYWSTGANNENEVIVLGQILMLRSRRFMYLSQDSGATWVQSSYQGIPVYTNGDLAIPKNCIQLGNTWFGTCGIFGVYVSNDFGFSWQPLSVNPEFIARGGLANLNGVLYSGSYYDGVWRRTNPFYNVSGNVFYDLNGNGIKDAGETSLPNIVMTTIPSGFVANTNAAGDFSFQSDMTGSLKAVAPTVFSNFSPSSYAISGNASGLDFALSLDPGINDLKVDITNINVFNPGFSTSLSITGKNIGSQIQSAIIKVILDSVLQYSTATPVPTTVINDTLVWNTTAMAFNEATEIKLVVETSIGTPLGYLAKATAMILPLDIDTTPNDNIYTLQDTVVASYDPNDKTCLQGAFFTSTQLESNSELEYVIRFQNTGTFPTNFVIITDTLSYYFDPSSLRIIASSHPMTWELNGHGVLKVIFNPLSLPPSVTDELGSHGFVKFGIKCKETVVMGNTLSNKANIYFDFNSPIITNTALTLVADPAILSESDIQIRKENAMLIYPNPARNEINLVSDKLNGLVSNVTLFNGMGQVIYSHNIISSPCKLDLSGLPAGLYFGRVNNMQGELIGVFRLMKVD